MEDRSLPIVLHNIEQLLPQDIPLPPTFVEIPGKGIRLCLVPIDRIKFFNALACGKLSDELSKHKRGRKVRVEWNGLNHRPKDELLYLMGEVNRLIKTMGFIPYPPT